MKKFDTPVLITIWDNPDYIIQLLKAISGVRPTRMYVFSDTIADKESERYRKIKESRRIVKDLITWDAEVSYCYNEFNEGPSWGIHNAITWAFETTDRLIILEHDYIPAKSFFHYCAELLEKYLTDERIWIISGLNHFEGKYNLNKEDSYFFSKFASIAGFATWKRCWDKVDNRMQKWPVFVKNKYRFDDFSKKEWKLAFKKYNDFYTKRVLKGQLNTWDAQFVFAMMSSRGTGIVPAQNLIKMIGVEGYNTKGKSPFHFFVTYDDFAIVKHPDFIQNNRLYDDKYFELGYFYNNRTIVNKLTNRAKKMIKYFWLKFTSVMST